MFNKLFDTVKRLWSKDENKQDNSAGTTTSAAPAYNEQQTPKQQQTTYRDNSIVKVTQPKQAGLYQYKSDKGDEELKDKEVFNQQYKHALSLGYDKQQAFKALRNGTRWKEVALGENNRPIISYQKQEAGDDDLKDKDYFNSQYKHAIASGMSKEEAFEAFRSGTRWREQTDVEARMGNARNENAAKGTSQGPASTYFDRADTRFSSAYTGKFGKVMDNPDFEEKSKPGESKTGRIFGNDYAYDYINNIGDARKNVELSMAQMRGDQGLSKYAYMTEDEVGIYNYLYNTKGKDQADEFLKSIDQELNAQRFSGEAAAMNDAATSSAGNAALMSAVTAAGQPIRSIASAAAGVEDFVSALRGEEIDPNSRFRAPALMTTEMRQAVSKKIDEYNGKYSNITSKELLGGQKLGSFAYNTTMSALDSAVNYLTTKYLFAPAAGIGMAGGQVADIDKYMKAMNAIASLTMSSEVATLGVAESKSKGYTNEAALTIGLVRGAIEYYSEKMGGEWAIKWIKKNPLSLLNSILYSMVPEGTEEVMSDVGNEIFNLIFDQLFGTQESAWHLMLNEIKANGSQNPVLDLLKAIRDQEIMSFAGGAFSALASGTSQHFSNKSAINNTAKNFNTSAEAVVDLMNQFGIENVTDIDRLAKADNLETIDEVRKELAKAESVRAAIDTALKRQAEAQQETSDIFGEEEETDELDIPDYRAMVYEADSFSALTDEQIDDYAKRLQQEIQALVNTAADQDTIDDLEEELNDVMHEGARRQTSREAAEKAAKEAAKTNKQTANNEPINIESTPSEEYNGTVETTEGATENGSNQGNAESNPAAVARQASLDAQSDVEEASYRESYGQNPGERENVQESKESGNRESAETRATDTAAESVGERGNAGNRTVQRAVSEERSGRVDKVFDAVDRHFRIADNFLKSPARHYENVKNLSKFCVKSLSSVFGSKENASKFVKAWVSDEVNLIYISPALKVIFDHKSGLSRNQQLAAQQTFAAQQIMYDLYSGYLSAQDIADIGGFDLETAQNILDNAKQNMEKVMAGERILNSDGSIKSFPFREQSNKQVRQSGANNTVANIASGESAGTAQTLELTEKYKAEKNDKEIRTNNKFGNKIYQRGNSYLVVNKGGYVLATLTQGDEKDLAEVMRKAHAVANKSSASYGVASVRLFGKDVYFNDETGMVLNTGSIFTKNNMISVQRSLASDEMKIAYSDMERGSQKGTTAWFKLNLGVERGDDIGSLTRATSKIRNLIQSSMTVDENGHRGVRMSNGKYYVFFGMTANGAKKGEAIMVSEEYYDNLRTKSLAGKTEAEVKKFNPAKYLTASASIFSPSNNDTGIKIAPKGKDGKRHPQVAVIGDVYTTRIDTLRRYMRVDNELDTKALTESFTKTMTRKLKAQGLSQTQIDAEIAKADIPGQVKQIIDNSTVGSVINIMTDVMFQATDGTGFVDLPEGSPYEGQSIQMRSLGGFKAQLVGMKFSDYLHDVIPYNPDAEYLYYGEEGEVAGGFRYQDKNVGVEVLSYWGDEWIPVKDLRAILFNSTVKFAGEFSSTEEFYEKTGDADLRSIPRENVYGVNVSDSTFEGYRLRGLGQLLRSQFNFTDEEVHSVLYDRLDEVIDSIQSNPRAAAKMFGVDFDGPAPSKADGKAYAIWLHGPGFMNTWDGKRWVAEKLGQLVKDMRSGDFPFKFDEQAFGWVDPDAVGLVHAMTTLTKINGEISDTVGGGFGLDGYAGLTPGQIFNANLANSNNDSRTVVGRFPSTKATDVQIRQNVDKNDANYKTMVEKYGLDKGNIYVAINDTLSMYLDNDYDGDPVISFQGALAELMEKIRSRDFTDENGKPLKTNVFVATAKGIQSQEVEGADRGPVEFSHAKADKVELVAKNIGDAVHAYLSVNDNTSAEHKGPRPVGMYDNMVERLAAIPNSMLEKPAKEAGMTVKEYRAQLEATFGVAYVLSIDYAKTGREFKEFFTLVERLDGMLYDIAEENGLIAARELDDNGNKITKDDSFAPAWWENSNSPSKQEKFASAKKKGTVADNPNTLLSAIGRILPAKAERGNGFSSWYDTFKDKLGKGSRERPNWAGAMTATPQAYKQYSDSFFDSLSKLYRQITADDNPEFRKLKKAYENAGRDVKDVDIRNYLVYKHIQQGLNLTNEQFTDLMLMMLTKNGGSSGTLLNYDQSQYDKNNTQMSTKDIIQRNIKLTKTYEQSVKSMTDIYKQVSTVSRVLVKARESISQLLDKQKTALNAIDASRVARIADMQNYLEAGNERLQQSLNDLSINARGNAKSVDVETLDDYRSELEGMLDRIDALKQQLNSGDSVFASGIATDTKNIYGDVTKEVRGILRQVNTLERNLNELYDAYRRQAANTAVAAENASNQFWQAVTGLEGLNEQDILNKIGETNNARESGTGADQIHVGNGRREGVQHQGAAGTEAGRRESSTDNPAEQGTGKGSGPQIRVNTNAETKAQTSNPFGTYDLAESSRGNKLSVSFNEKSVNTIHGKTSNVAFIFEDAFGNKTYDYLAEGGEVIPTSKMTPAQKVTQRLLKKFGVHVIFTTSSFITVNGDGTVAPKTSGGVSFDGSNLETGERFVYCNINSAEGRTNVRHEVTHSLINMLSTTANDSRNKAVRLAWMQNVYKSITDFSPEQKKAGMDAIQNLYGDIPYKKHHEFLAQLFSGGNYYDALPGLATQFMKDGYTQYQKTGVFPYLSDLIDQIAPNASALDKAALLEFYIDPYTGSPERFASIEAETTAEQTTEQPTEQQTEEIKPLPFGNRRKSISKSAARIQSIVDGTIKGLAGKDTRKVVKYTKVLRNFNEAVKMMLKGKATTDELYTAYNALKGSLYHDETVDPYFDALINKNQFVNEDAFNEAVDHALAKFAAHSAQVVKAEETNTNLENQAKKYDTEGLKKAINFFGSWQLNAPTWFKSLMGYQRGTTGYKLASDIETANKNMQRYYWKAYQHIENVAKMEGFRDLINGDIRVNIARVNRNISSIEAINLLRMLKTVEYTQGDLSNVKGFTLQDGTRVRTALRTGKYSEEIASSIKADLQDYFDNRASAVEKAYYKALDAVFDEFTPEVRRLGKTLNGYIDMIPSDRYSPISWGKGSIEESFDPREAQLKTDPRYMKTRVEEAGGYLYAVPMSDVIESYIRRMSDYLAFGELREQMRIMNHTAENRQSKTLGQIAGENMGADYARFINNYVRDLIHYSENSDSFWYKARSLMQKGTLVGNASVMMKQSASYLNAASVIDMKYLIRALGPNKFSRDYANGKSGLLEYRRITGNFDPTITDIFGQKASRNPLVRLFQNGISIIDHATVKRLYIAACLQVEAEGIDRNSPQFDNAVENLFAEAAIQTQPQFDPSLRPENSRTKNEGVRMLSMFRTQQSLNFNKLVTAIGEYQTSNDAKTRKQLASTIGGLIGSSMALAMFTAVSDAVLHRRRKYKDEEGEITPESVVSRIGVGAAEALAGTVWLGDDAAKFIIDQLGLVESQEFYGLSMGPVSTIYDATTALGDFITALKEGKGYVNAGKKFAAYVTQSLGVPANNAYNYINAVAMYALDHMGENPDEYDDLTKWLDNNLKAQKQLIKAAEAGNKKKTNKMWETLNKRYSEPKEQLNKQLKIDYNRGKVSEDTAQNLLIVYGGLEDQVAAQKRTNKWDFDKEHPEYSKIVTESFAWKWKQTVEPTGVNLDTYVDAIKYYKQINADKENGNDSRDMMVYLSGLNLTDEQMSAVYSTFGSNLYQQYNPEEGAYAKYTEYGKPAGISVSDFVTYYEHFNSLSSDKDKNGKTITGSKQKKVIEYINSLPISKEQKDALWKSFNYTTTTKAWKTRPWK